MLQNRSNTQGSSQQKENFSQSVSGKNSKTKEYGIYFLIPNGDIKRKSLDIASQHHCSITAKKKNITFHPIAKKTLKGSESVREGFIK